MYLTCIYLQQLHTGCICKHDQGKPEQSMVTWQPQNRTAQVCTRPTEAKHGETSMYYKYVLNVFILDLAQANTLKIKWANLKINWSPHLYIFICHFVGEIFPYFSSHCHTRSKEISQQIHSNLDPFLTSFKACLVVIHNCKNVYYCLSLYLKSIIL